jgi:H+-transporting ATPase
MAIKRPTRSRGTPSHKPVASAPLRHVDVRALTVDQSALTGESKDAEKTSGSVLSSGSIVRRGEGNGVVMLTGAKTYFGRTTELVQEARPKLHIEAVVAKVVRWLFVIVGTDL